MVSPRLSEGWSPREESHAWVWSRCRVPSHLETSHFFPSLKDFNCLDRAYLNYGGWPALLNVYSYTCQWHLRHALTAISRLVSDQFSGRYSLAKLTYKINHHSPCHLIFIVHHSNLRFRHHTTSPVALIPPASLSKGPQLSYQAHTYNPGYPPNLKIFNYVTSVNFLLS